MFISINLGNINEKALVITIVAYCTVFPAPGRHGDPFDQAHHVQDYFLNRSRKKKSILRLWKNRNKRSPGMKMPPSVLRFISILLNYMMKKSM